MKNKKTAIQRLITNRRLKSLPGTGRACFLPVLSLSKTCHPKSLLAYFELKHWETADAGSFSHFSAKKLAINFPEECAFPVPGRDEHSHHKRLESTLMWVCTNRVKQPSSSTSLVSSIHHQFSSPVQTPLSCHFLTNVFFFCLKGIKTSYSGHIFRASFSYDGPHVHVKM